MAKVVYSTISSLEKLESAQWVDGDNESYTRTQKMVRGHPGEIGLIGRMAADRSVQICYAAKISETPDCDTPWVVAGAAHVKLAKYFLDKFENRPDSWDGGPFFKEIDDETARNVSQTLIALECGINVNKEPWGALHLAVLQVERSLRELGVFCSDWTFIPMFNSFKPMSS